MNRAANQECNYLANIRHPHIALCLGMTTDPESRLKVLLMEQLKFPAGFLFLQNWYDVCMCVWLSLCPWDLTAS